MTANPEIGLRELQAAGFLLPPILSTEQIRQALGLQTTSAVVRLHRREGLPLARVGRRYVVTRQALQCWIDNRATKQVMARGRVK